jgi:hypothetical protein
LWFRHSNPDPNPIANNNPNLFIKNRNERP